MKNKLLALAIGIVMIMGIGGCTSSSASNSTAENTNSTALADTSTSTTELQLSGTVDIIGSTTVQPLAQSVADLMNKSQPNLNIAIQGVGSGAGIKAVIDGTTDIGMASRELKEDEKSAGVDEHIIAYDGIAVIVNPKNAVSDLTTQQIKDIFEGNITNWKDVGGNDADIIVVSREAGSGTRGAFEELIKLTKRDENGNEISSLKPDALVQSGNGDVQANISSKENAIGYMSEGYLNDSVKALKVDNIECSVENIKAGTYKLSRPLLLLTKGEISESAKAYIDFFLSDEGQNIVSEKYIAVK